MAGQAITDNFMLGSATVMLGAQADLFDLNPEDHSIGLVKNFRITQEPTFTDLTQGRTNSLVYSAKTGATARATMESYEYSSRNMAYSLGLEGASFGPSTAETSLDSAVVADDTTITVADATGLAVDAWINIHGAEDDNVQTRKITAIVGTDVTLNLPLKKAIAAGSKVTGVSILSVGSTEEQPFLAAKVVGHLANDKAIVMLFNKVRVTNGFSVGFTTEDFDNMPMELAFYDSVSTDPNYELFKKRQGILATPT